MFQRGTKAIRCCFQLNRGAHDANKCLITLLCWQMRMHKYVCKYLYNHILVNVQVSAEHVYVPLFSLAYLIDCMHVRENKEHIPLLSCQYSGIILTKVPVNYFTSLCSSIKSRGKSFGICFHYTEVSCKRCHHSTTSRGRRWGEKKVQKYIASACFNILGP